MLTSLSLYPLSHAHYSRLQLRDFAMFRRSGSNFLRRAWVRSISLSIGPTFLLASISWLPRENSSSHTNTGLVFLLLDFTEAMDQILCSSSWFNCQISLLFSLYSPFSFFLALALLSHPQRATFSSRSRESWLSLCTRWQISLALAFALTLLFHYTYRSSFLLHAECLAPFYFAAIGAIFLLARSRACKCLIFFFSL